MSHHERVSMCRLCNLPPLILSPTSIILLALTMKMRNFMYPKFLISFATLVITLSGVAHSAPTLGHIHVQDGSQLHGEIISMVDGTLKAKATL